MSACGGGPPPHPPTRVDPTADGAVAVRLERGLPIVGVRVRAPDGTWFETPLVLDLGAAQPVTLTGPVLARAATTPTTRGPATRTIYTARGDALTVRRRTLAGLRLAGRTWRTLPVDEAAWHHEYAPPVQVGVIGWPLLAGAPFVVDLGAGRLVLGAPPLSPARCVPVEVDGRGLSVRLDVAGRPVRAILDTAATATVVTDAALAGEGDVRLGGRLVTTGPRHHVALAGLPADALLGVPFFRAHRVHVDPARGCLAVD